MTIKNPDGSIFQLKKPNPLLKSQDVTSDSHLIHNFQVDEITVRYRKKKPVLQPVGAVVGKADQPPLLPHQPVAPSPTEKLVVSVTPNEPYVPPMENPVIVEPPIDPGPITDDEDDYLTDNDAATVDAVSCWCLPGEYKKHYDNLYGETRKSVQWGDKFIFEGIIVESTEMNFQIYAQIAIKPPSIVFIRSHRRWWRVTDVQPQDNGYVMSCLPSDTRPRFD